MRCETRYCLESAKYYLFKMNMAACNDNTFNFNYCAFLFAARNITFRMQKEYSKRNGFKDWYVKVQKEMGASELLRKIIQNRNKCAHEGDRISAANYFLTQMHNNFQEDEIFSYDLSSFLNFIKNILEENPEIKGVEIDFARRARNYDNKQKSITLGATRALEFSASIKLVGCDETIIENSNDPETEQQSNEEIVKKTIARWLYDVKTYSKRCEDLERANIVSICEKIMQVIEGKSHKTRSATEDLEKNPKEGNLEFIELNNTNNTINECKNQLEIYERYVNECEMIFGQEILCLQ